MKKEEVIKQVKESIGSIYTKQDVINIINLIDVSESIKQKRVINIFLNGEFDTAHEERVGESPVRIYNKGTHVQILEDQFDQYIDGLEESGYESYFCPELYSHPQWNGEIIYL
jgi:nucleoid DNA-binding protein